MNIIWISWGGHRSPKSSKEEIPQADVVNLLNRSLDETGLSVLALAGLKAAGFTKLEEFRRAVEESRPLKTLGIRSRLEINKLFKKNNIALPAGWMLCL